MHPDNTFTPLLLSHLLQDLEESKSYRDTEPPGYSD